jgi:hypothetical protein
LKAGDEDGRLDAGWMQRVLAIEEAFKESEPLKNENSC